MDCDLGIADRRRVNTMDTFRLLIFRRLALRRWVAYRHISAWNELLGRRRGGRTSPSPAKKTKRKMLCYRSCVQLKASASSSSWFPKNLWYWNGAFCLLKQEHTSMSEELPYRTFSLVDEVVCPDPIIGVQNGTSNVAVLDNGCWKARLDWATESNPRLIYRNLLARLRPDLIGNDVKSIDALSIRSSLRSPFERNVLTQFEIFENVLDYGRRHLNSDLRDVPCVVTEAPLNPDYCRIQVAEIFFEKFDVASLLTGIDGLFSVHHHDPTRGTYMNVVLGHTTCHILPVVCGQLRLEGVQRLNLGGYDATLYLQKLLQLKNPWRASTVTFTRCEEIIRNLCKFSEEGYMESLSQWHDEDGVEIFLPAAAAVPTEVDLEAKKAQELARKENQVKRLKEMHRTRLERKLESLQVEFEELNAEADGEDEDIDASLEKQRLALNSQITKTREKLASLNEFGAKSNEKSEEWLEEMRSRRQHLLDKKEKIRARNAEMGNRHSRAARDRLRMLSQLASEDKTAAGRKKEKRDTFGARDEDWEVYMVVGRENWDSEHDVDTELREIERLLAQYDEEHKALLSCGTTSFRNTLHLATECIRVPELLFQPAALVGSKQAGLSFGLETSFKAFDAETAQELADNIIVCGGFACIPGLKVRLENEIRAMRPFESTFNVEITRDPVLGSWKGAAEFARDPTNSEYFVTRSDYFEKGSRYFLEHKCSNRSNAANTNATVHSRIVCGQIKLIIPEVLRSGMSTKDGPLQRYGDWSMQISSTGKKYYYNYRTSTSQWEKPAEWAEYELKDRNRHQDRRDLPNHRSQHGNQHRPYHRSVHSNNSGHGNNIPAHPSHHPSSNRYPERSSHDLHGRRDSGSSSSRSHSSAAVRQERRPSYHSTSHSRFQSHYSSTSQHESKPSSGADWSQGHHYEQPISRSAPNEAVDALMAQLKSGVKVENVDQRILTPALATLRSLLHQRQQQTGQNNFPGSQAQLLDALSTPGSAVSAALTSMLGVPPPPVSVKRKWSEGSPPATDYGKTLRREDSRLSNGPVSSGITTCQSLPGVTLGLFDDESGLGDVSPPTPTESEPSQIFSQDKDHEVVSRLGTNGGISALKEGADGGRVAGGVANALPVAPQPHAPQQPPPSVDLSLFAKYVNQDLIGHVANPLADALEKQLNAIRAEMYHFGNVQMVKCASNLKRDRSLVRVAEIQSTRMCQRIMSLQDRQKAAESKDLRQQTLKDPDHS
ncbi:unnamed protein product [Notodromas monacha]|uniref:WW domain-containing protein n=1 Tax=Notodromas monacha TaxID=399045 RepID=A0A7R9BPT2_9CRUS|nr:unnamed protein product [Notodromas monacha]CAG0919409.1 unnamed protein product [Notodromas monacha]